MFCACERRFLGGYNAILVEQEKKIGPIFPLYTWIRMAVLVVVYGRFFYFQILNFLEQPYEIDCIAILESRRFSNFFTFMCMVVPS